MEPITPSTLANSPAARRTSIGAFGLKLIERSAEGLASSTTSLGKIKPAERISDNIKAEGAFKLLIFGLAAPESLSIAEKKAGFKEVGRDHTKLRLAVMRFVHVTDSPEEALAAAESFRYSTRVAVALRFDYGEFDGTLHHDIPAREEPTLEQMRDNMIIGDAETCAERIVDEINCLEPAHYICYMKGGSLSGDRVLRSLEKFGTHVMPQVEKAIPNLDDIGGNIDQRAKQGLEVTNCVTR